MLLLAAPGIAKEHGAKDSGKKGREKQAASATLTWDAPTTNTDGSPLKDLKGYYIYYRQPDEEDFDEDRRITVLLDDKGLKCRKAGKDRAGGTECTYVVRGLRGPYYIAVSAFGKKNESELSNEVLKELPAKADRDKKSDNDR